MTAKDIRPPEEVPGLMERVARMVPEQESFAKVRPRKKDGAIMEGEVKAYAFTFTNRPAALVQVMDVTERLRTEEALQQAHETLAASVKELEQREKDIIRLSGMAQMLQSCQTAGEAYSIVSQSISQLLPG